MNGSYTLPYDLTVSGQKYYLSWTMNDERVTVIDTEYLDEGQAISLSVTSSTTELTIKFEYTSPDGYGSFNASGGTYTYSAALANTPAEFSAYRTPETAVFDMWDTFYYIDGWNVGGEGEIFNSIEESLFYYANIENVVVLNPVWRKALSFEKPLNSTAQISAGSFTFLHKSLGTGEKDFYVAIMNESSEDLVLPTFASFVSNDLYDGHTEDKVGVSIFVHDGWVRRSSDAGSDPQVIYAIDYDMYEDFTDEDPEYHSDHVFNLIPYGTELVNDAVVYIGDYGYIFPSNIGVNTGSGSAEVYKAFSGNAYKAHNEVNLFEAYKSNTWGTTFDFNNDTFIKVTEYATNSFDGDSLSDSIWIVPSSVAYVHDYTFETEAFYILEIANFETHSFYDTPCFSVETVSGASISLTVNNMLLEVEDPYVPVTANLSWYVYGSVENSVGEITNNVLLGQVTYTGNGPSFTANESIYDSRIHLYSDDIHYYEDTAKVVSLTIRMDGDENVMFMDNIQFCHKKK